MSIVVDLLKVACANLGFSYHIIGNNDALLSISFHGTTHLVLNAALGLNSDAELKISRDKDYTHQLLSPSILMPDTKSYIDPLAPVPYSPYITKTEDEIVEDIVSSFSFPVIVKRNSGTQGKNVFLCHSKNDVLKALKRIFSKEQMEYDHVLLAQAYVHPKREFRVIILEGTVELVYHKDNSNAEFLDNLSPLHWNHSVARVMADKGVIARIQEIVTRMHGIFPITYAGLDVIESDDGSLWLIEVNSTPQYSEFVKANGSDAVIQLLSEALQVLARRCTH